MVRRLLVLTLTFTVLASPSTDLDALRARLRDAMASHFGCVPEILMVWDDPRAPIRVEATCEVPALSKSLSPTDLFGGF